MTKEDKPAAGRDSHGKGQPRRWRDQSAAESQAERHRRIRDDHSVEIAEDYVELIAQLIVQHGEARTVDIAKRLGVSHVTVTKTIGRLQREGLVRSEPYRSIFLTGEGEALAARSAARHALIVAFLRKLGVGETDAETDAEGIEHHVSNATLDAIRHFMDANAS